MRAVAVIPWFDSGCPYRRKNVDRVEEWYRSNFDGRVVVGKGTNRGECRNNGFRRNEAEVYLFGDADIIPHDPQVINDALLYARETNQLYIGFDKLYRENELGIPGYYETGHKGGILIISRESFEKVNGFPELNGWGFEDLIFYAKCRGLLGLSLIHISEPTRLLSISYAVF